jgi:homogentisate 1,2-dioxygenase
VKGIRTVSGQGDAASKEGLAIHIYSANASMGRRAFCNNDGDFLILPQHGRLNIQTELGWMMVRPGELAVIQAGIRFRVLLPDGPSRGYIQEIFGAHYELPELGPFGSNGMALPQDFESPVASFDVESEEWEIVYKMTGSLYSCRQHHTPFDVVAWRGNLVPYKYATEKFINVANVERDQADPTVYCVLTARSKVPGVSLADFLVFTPKWISTSNTFRPPYYHRKMSTEMMGLLYGTYGGSSHVLEPGGLSYEASYMPHGETYETWVDATTRELRPERICEDTVAFMFHISVPLLLTEWAENGEGSKSLNLTAADQWDGAKAHFLDHLSEVDAELKMAGLPTLGSQLGPEKAAAKTNGVNGVNGLNGVNGVNGAHVNGKTNGVHF